MRKNLSLSSRIMIIFIYAIILRYFYFQDRSRRLNTTDCRQLPQHNRAWQGLSRLLGLHDKGTQGQHVFARMVYRRMIRCVASGKSSTGTRARFQIGVLLGGEENSTKKQMQAIITFETELAKITIPPEERRDEEKLYNLMSLNELQRKAPFVRLLSSTRLKIFFKYSLFSYLRMRPIIATVVIFISVTSNNFPV